jgi:hypothetical protein
VGNKRNSLAGLPLHLRCNGAACRLQACVQLVINAKV